MTTRTSPPLGTDDPLWPAGNATGEPDLDTGTRDTPAARTRLHPWPAWAIALAGLAVAVGLVFRFWTRSDLWLDEALTVNVAKLPVSRILSGLRHDGAPPLYYLLLHFWMRVFGSSDLAVRSLSGVISVATLPVMWLAGRRLGGRSTAWVAVLLLATSPFAVRYATETRMYSLVILLTLLGYLALARARETHRARDVIALALVSGLLLLSHYWALYLLLAVGGVLVWQMWRARATALATTGSTAAGGAAWALAGVLAGGVLFLPWAPTFVFQLRHTGTPWAEPARFSAMVNAVSEFAGGRSSGGRALGLTFFALAGFGLFGMAIDGHRVELDLRTRPRGRGLAVVTAGTLAVAIVVGLATKSAFSARYTAVVFPIFLLLVSLGVGVLADRRMWAGVLAAAMAFGLGTATGNVTTNRTQAGRVAAALRAGLQPGDAVGYCPDQLGPGVSRLIPGGVTQLTFPHQSRPELVDWVDYKAHNRAGDPGAFARAVSDRAGPSHAVWLVWSSNYRTLDGKCEAITAALAALRPGAQEVVKLDADHFYEHDDLIRYPAR